MFLNTGVNNGAPSWPNRIGDGKLDDPSVDLWFDINDFAAPPPNSTGRDLFNAAWLDRFAAGFMGAAQDMQATLAELTAQSRARAIRDHCAGAAELYLCGGGARNPDLVRRIADALPNVRVAPTDAIGVASADVEALAFAWLARETIAGRPGNVPEVTGANGPRVLGAIYPRGA